MKSVLREEISLYTEFSRETAKSTRTNKAGMYPSTLIEKAGWYAKRTNQKAGMYPSLSRQNLAATFITL